MSERGAPTFDEVQGRHVKHALRAVRGARGGGFKKYAYCSLDEQPWPCDAMSLALEREKARGVVVHKCPPHGSGTMPCCGLSPFERMRDRMTLDPLTVTCSGVPA